MLQIITCDHFAMTEHLELGLDLSAYERVSLRTEIDHEKLQFFYATEADQWQKVGPVLDMRILSDDYVRAGEERYRPAFTGCFVGLCCQDLSGRKIAADFDWWEYEEIP